jgi:hypothetical protein
MMDSCLDGLGDGTYQIMVRRTQLSPTYRDLVRTYTQRTENLHSHSDGSEVMTCVWVSVPPIKKLEHRRAMMGKKELHRASILFRNS